jgi:hypothetical protein
MSRPQLRQHPSAPGLLKAIRQSFAAIPDHRHERSAISLTDALMSGLPVFGLKYPSLLQFEQERNEELIRSSLRHSLGSTKRRVLRRCGPSSTRWTRPNCAGRFVRCIATCSAKAPYRYWAGHAVLLVDRTGHFASSNIRCPQCCVKESQGKAGYDHQLLGAVLAHPPLKTVLPVTAEAITRQNGENKNDCERSAAKRLLVQLRREYPKLKLIVVEHSLAANGPLVELLGALNLRDIIGVKEGDHEALFEAVQERLRAGETEQFEATDERGRVRGFRFVNDLPFNKTHPHLRVDFLEYWEIEDGQKRLLSWVTDTAKIASQSLRNSRASWRVFSCSASW